VSLLAGAASVALLAIFEPAPAPIPVRDLLSSASLLLGSATVTALAAPILFVIVRRLDAIGVHRRDEAEAHAP
ncbi:MAG: hypothetical protein OEY14_00045, partial [Myxococcales bacterium]|nr:hypothetical protein [Myxococcales bacterium]